MAQEDKKNLKEKNILKFLISNSFFSETIFSKNQTKNTKLMNKTRKPAILRLAIISRPSGSYAAAKLKRIIEKCAKLTFSSLYVNKKQMEKEKKNIMYRQIIRSQRNSPPKLTEIILESNFYCIYNLLQSHSFHYQLLF